MKLPRSQTPAQRRASILFAGSRHNYGSGAGCRIEYAGPLPSNGGPSRVSISGIRWEDRQRATYRHWTGARLKKSDRVVAICGSPRCLDRRHLYVIPAPVTPKPLKASLTLPSDASADPAAVSTVAPPDAKAAP